jgi:diamine N-acetyltransferase
VSTSVPRPPPTERAPGTTSQAPLHVRVGEGADADLLAELGARTFHAAYAGDVAEASLAPHVEATFGSELQARELADPATCHLVAERDGRALGYAYLTELDGAVAFLARLYVDPAHTGSGVGQQLLDRCLEEAGRRGCSGLRLTVWTANTRAIAFYRRNGFAITGEVRFLLGEEEQTDLVMERSLPPAA